MNLIAINGRLTRDPELRTGRTAAARFSVAVDFFKNGEKTADFYKKIATTGVYKFHNVHCFNISADVLFVHTHEHIQIRDNFIYSATRASIDSVLPYTALSCGKHGATTLSEDGKKENRFNAESY